MCCILKLKNKRAETIYIKFFLKERKEKWEGLCANKRQQIQIHNFDFREKASCGSAMWSQARTWGLTAHIQTLSLTPMACLGGPWVSDFCSGAPGAE